MSSIRFDVGPVGRAESKFRDAFERLKQGKPQLLAKGSKVTQNNVAKEAGVDPSALRRSRFPNLALEIQEWIETNRDTETNKTPRQMMLTQRSRNRTLHERNACLQVQRDEALLRLVHAEARIVELTNQNERLLATRPASTVAPLRPAERGDQGLTKPNLREIPK